MINVCTNCLKLNPLGEKKCGYCRHDCQAIKSNDFGGFMLGRQSKNKSKEGQKVLAEEDENIFEEYPDLKIFEECRNLPDPFDLVIARP